MKREQLVELARLCANQARATSAKDVAATLWRMAQEYQQKAARLDSGKLPDIGEKHRPLKRNGCYANSKLRTELRWIHPVVHFDPK